MQYDVCVLGGGPSGLIAMLRLAEAGFQVLGLECGVRPKDYHDDTRSTAFLKPALDTLQKAGVWDKLSEFTTPLKTMEICDAAQTPMKRVAFEAREIGQDAFAQNIQNHALKSVLLSQAENHPNITLKFETELKRLHQFDNHVELDVSGSRIETRLLVGADGRHSSLREKLNIEVKSSPYDQWAQAFTVTHEAPHHDTSTEVHLEGGPFTTVPCPDHDGKPTSAIVYMNSKSAVEQFAQMDTASFEEHINIRSQGVRGQMRIISEVARFPMMTQSARELHIHRAVLIGEAAHVVPPIGAQGLNMSVRDIESLTRACETGALQNPSQLAAWARARKNDIALRIRGIDALNQVSIANFDRAETLRRLGLWAMDKETPLRNLLMRAGLGR